MRQPIHQLPYYDDQQLIIADVRMLYGIVGFLCLIGLLFIYSASSVYALESMGSSAYYVKKQFVGIIVGCAAFCVGRFIPFAFIKRMSPWLFLGTLALTALTLVPQFAQHIHGSSRWIVLFRIAFQPSELLKITFIIYTAYLLEKYADQRSSFIKGFVPLVLPLIAVAGVLLKQPDFGLTATLTFTLLFLLFSAQVNTRFLWGMIALVIPVLAGLVYWKPYRLKRVLTFLNPWQDPQGSGFQIIQSLIAIGSGGWAGVGLSQSKQKFFYLPMQHTDFIFSIIAEETGFIGSALIIFVFILLLYRGMRLACRMNTPFSAYYIQGFIIVITLQALINIGVATGLFPTKGVGLPFVSYGNSSIVCLMGALGLVGNAAYAGLSRDHQTVYDVSTVLSSSGFPH